MSYGKKDVFFYGDYDARNMRLQKSRDLGGLGHFLVDFSAFWAEWGQFEVISGIVAAPSVPWRRLFFHLQE